MCNEPNSITVSSDECKYITVVGAEMSKYGLQ